MKCPHCQRELSTLHLRPIHVQTYAESMTGFGLVCPLCDTLLNVSLAPFVVAQTVQHMARRLQNLHNKIERSSKKGKRTDSDP